MKIIRDLFRFLKDGLKNDYETIKIICNGEYKPQYTKKEVLSSIPNALKEYKLFFLVVVLAFFCGVFMSSQYWQNECNSFINEEIVPQCSSYDNSYNMPSFNDWIELNESEKEIFSNNS